MVDRLSRLYCRIFGHDWELAVDPRSDHRPFFVCSRDACRGFDDAWRWN